ncbi:MAG: hypothetical protein ABF633_03460 [Clostridium sp.]|uniref:hypothetical protein n=1 Tax=Clostridium sp. TaxID=1506 RepID=UPI0039E880AC
MGRNCGECKFYEVFYSQEPCSRCDEYGSEFVDSEEPSLDCDTCKFEDVNGYDQPCDDCYIDNNKWEAKVTADSFECDICKYEKFTCDEFPCDLCTKENYMFEPQEVEEEEVKEKCEGHCGSCGSCSCPEPPEEPTADKPINKTEVIELPADLTLIVKNGSIVALEDGEYLATYTEDRIVRALIKRILGGK